METKVCPKCGEEKPLTGEFWYKKKQCGGPCNGRLYWRKKCKKCYREEKKPYETIYREKNKARIKITANSWARKNYPKLKDSDQYFVNLLRNSLSKQMPRKSISINSDMIELAKERDNMRKTLYQFEKELIDCQTLKPKFFICNKCGVNYEFNTDNYSVNRNQSYGLRKTCRKCENLNRKQRRIQNESDRRNVSGEQQEIKTNYDRGLQQRAV